MMNGKNSDVGGSAGRSGGGCGGGSVGDSGNGGASGSTDDGGGGDDGLVLV